MFNCRRELNGEWGLSEFVLNGGTSTRLYSFEGKILERERERAAGRGGRAEYER